MKNNIAQILLVILVVLPNLLCLGQTENSWEIKHEPEYLATIKDVKNVLNSRTKDLYSFITEPKKTTLYVTNSKHEMIKSFEWDKKIFKSVILKNTLFVQDVIHCVSLNDKGIVVKKINTKDGIISTVIHELNFKNEGHYTIVKHEGKLQIINVLKKSPIIRVYTYDGINPVKEYDIALKEEGFLTSKELFQYSSFSKVKIFPNLPVEITTSQYPIKIYPNQNNVSVSIEHMHKTYTFRIDFDKMSCLYFANEANVLKRNLASFVRFNSFLFEDKLLQTISTKQGREVEVYIKDLASDVVLKTYKIERNKPIEFMNSDMVVNYGEKGSRVLSRSNQFIRKASSINGQLSISAFRLGKDIQLNLGGVSLQQGPVVAYTIAFGIVGGVIAAKSMYLNSMSVMYNNYAYSKVASIKCLFDSEFNSIDGKIQENVFDRIKQDDKAFENLQCMSLITTDNEVIVGRYDSEKDLFVLTSYPLK